MILCSSLSESEVVFTMGRETPAKCAYCSEPLGDEHVQGELGVYCSSDCRTAGRMWCWLSLLLIITPYYVLFWTGYDGRLDIFTILVILLLLMFYFAFLVIQGIRIRRRISRDRKPDEIEFVEYN